MPRENSSLRILFLNKKAAGRITLTGDTLKITEHGEVIERKLNDEQEVQELLWNYFGIKF